MQCDKCYNGDKPREFGNPGRLGQGRQLHYVEHVTELQQKLRTGDFLGNPVGEVVLLLQSVGFYPWSGK